MYIKVCDACMKINVSQSNYKLSIQKLQLANQVVFPSYIFLAKKNFMSYTLFILFKTKQIRVREKKKKKKKKSEKDILTET